MRVVGTGRGAFPKAQACYELCVCRFVICLEHDMYLLQEVNASAQRITLLVAKCAAACDMLSSQRRQRAAMVTNVMFDAIYNGGSEPHLLLQHLGSWAFSLTSAHLSHYLSSQAVAGRYATMVRCLMYCTFCAG